MTINLQNHSHLESASIWHQKEPCHANHYANFPFQSRDLKCTSRADHEFFDSVKEKAQKTKKFGHHIESESDKFRDNQSPKGDKNKCVKYLGGAVSTVELQEREKY